jgi:virginiamycin B lyase
VAPAPDGTVWFTGQREGFLGRFDPRSGKFEKIPLGPGAAPHGVILGPDGAAWVTDGGQNAIARVDPASKAVRLFRLPADAGDANLNTPVFEKAGPLWFTGQSGIYGRLNPASGKVEVWKAPKCAGPYGMTVTPSGEVWYASFAGDHIARIDTRTGTATIVDPPQPGVHPRRIWSDSKGILWVSLWDAGAIGRYDPAAKSWRTYPRQSGTTAGLQRSSTRPRDGGLEWRPLLGKGAFRARSRGAADQPSVCDAIRQVQQERSKRC